MAPRGRAAGPARRAGWCMGAVGRPLAPNPGAARRAQGWLRRRDARGPGRSRGPYAPGPQDREAGDGGYTREPKATATVLKRAVAERRAEPPGPRGSESAVPEPGTVGRVGVWGATGAVSPKAPQRALCPGLPGRRGLKKPRRRRASGAGRQTPPGNRPAVKVAIHKLVAWATRPW